MRVVARGAHEVLKYSLTDSAFIFGHNVTCGFPFAPQMACYDGSKGGLEEDSYDGGRELSSCALAMLEKERESLLSPESPGTLSSNTSASLQASPPQQGYDVEFDPPLESKYECPICLMALRNAIQTPCGHRFCKNCIEKSIR